MVWSLPLEQRGRRRAGKYASILPLVLLSVWDLLPLIAFLSPAQLVAPGGEILDEVVSGWSATDAVVPVYYRPELSELGGGGDAAGEKSVRVALVP